MTLLAQAMSGFAHSFNWTLTEHYEGKGENVHFALRRRTQRSSSTRASTSLLLAKDQDILTFVGQAVLFEVRIPAPLLPDGIIATQSSEDLLLCTIHGRDGLFGIRWQKANSISARAIVPISILLRGRKSDLLCKEALQDWTRERDLGLHHAQVSS